MIAYKGFTSEMWSRLGDHKKENCSFAVGETKEAEEAKTMRTGFHCCENPFECLTYYGLNEGNRFCQVEAAGSIDEDADERISCTKITILQELTRKELAGYGMSYIIQHPQRQKWQQEHAGLVVAADQAEIWGKDQIAIARGKHPKVRGSEGAILGLILEPEPGEILAARLFVVTRQQASIWYTLDEDRNLQEVGG